MIWGTPQSELARGEPTHLIYWRWWCWLGLLSCYLYLAEFYWPSRNVLFSSNNALTIKWDLINMERFTWLLESDLKVKHADISQFERFICNHRTSQTFEGKFLRPLNHHCQKTIELGSPFSLAHNTAQVTLYPVFSLECWELSRGWKGFPPEKKVNKNY